MSKPTTELTVGNIHTNSVCLSGDGWNLDLAEVGIYLVEFMGLVWELLRQCSQLAN